ncbi:MAG: YXWGXW repeat-containing protein [Candidatus Rokuibacteriota bacterium]
MFHRLIRASIVGSLTLVLAGCATGPVFTTSTPPPMPQAPSEVMTPQPGPGYVWVPGHYTWRNQDRTYVWVPGHWTIPPGGHVWVPGHWETRPSGTVWVEGHWRRT